MCKKATGDSGGRIKERSFKTTVKEDPLDPQKYSSWFKLTRVVAILDRFISNCRLPAACPRKGVIQPDEIVAAGRRFVRLAQQEVFKDDTSCLLKPRKEISSKSNLLPLRQMVDEDGVLRCDGRLRYAESLPLDIRYPIILPQKH